MVKRQAWSDAVSLLMRFGEACDKGGASHSQAKAYLGAIVVWLYAGNVQQAWQVRAQQLGDALHERVYGAGTGHAATRMMQTQAGVGVAILGYISAERFKCKLQCWLTPAPVACVSVISCGVCDWWAAV